MTDQKSNQESFKWRGTTWRRGIGRPYHADPGVNFLSRQSMVWFCPEEQVWFASIVPNQACSARVQLRGASGRTPQQALDNEVTWWASTMALLPGAHRVLQGSPNADADAAS